jgi:hypothetical protein
MRSSEWKEEEKGKKVNFVENILPLIVSFGITFNVFLKHYKCARAPVYTF